MKKLLFAIAAVAAMTACGGDEDNGNKSIKLTGGTSTTQTVDADQTAKADGIRFRATADWYAKVSAIDMRTAGGSEVDWLTLNIYSGAAGDQTLSMTLEPNTTGSARKAQIRIVCDGSSITIIVEQKATTQSGDIPTADRLITKIEERDHGVLGEVWEFAYDTQARLIKIKFTDNDEDAEVVDAQITYGDGVVSYTSKAHSNKISSTDWDSSTATLDAAGRVVSATGTSYENKGTIEGTFEKCTYSYTLTYDANGYLSKSERRDGDASQTDEERCTWEGGHLTQVWWGTIGARDLIDKAKYGAVSNKTNLDLNWWILKEAEGFAFAAGDSNAIFAMMGYTGKRAGHLAEQVKEGYEVGETYQNLYAYTVDAAGYPTKIEYTNKDSVEEPTPMSSESDRSYTITYNR